MEADEYATLVAAASAAVRAAGKKVVGWQEIAHTPLEPGTVVQYWDTRVDPAPFVAAAQAGALLLMSPGVEGVPRHEVRREHRARPGVGRAHRAARRLRLGAVDPHRGRPGGVGDRRRGGRLDRDAARPAGAHADAAAAARRHRRGRLVRARAARLGRTSAPGSPRQAPFWDRLGLSWYREPAGGLARADRHRPVRPRSAATCASARSRTAPPTRTRSGRRTR